MSSGNLGHSDVKSILDNLECSPSQHDDSGHYGGKPSINPQAHNSTAVTSGTTLPTQTSEFHQKVSSGRDSKSGYKKGFAKKATQV